MSEADSRLHSNITRYCIIDSPNLKSTLTSEHFLLQQPRIHFHPTATSFKRNRQLSKPSSNLDTAFFHSHRHTTKAIQILEMPFVTAFGVIKAGFAYASRNSRMSISRLTSFASVWTMIARGLRSYLSLAYPCFVVSAARGSWR